MLLRILCCQLGLIALLGLSPVATAALELTAEEKSYLSNREPVKFCVDPSWMPFEAIDKQGRYTGVSSDFMEEFARILNIQLELVPTESWSESLNNAKQRVCDLLPMINISPEREQFLSFTEPYVSMPVVLISDQNTRYLDGLKSLEGHKLVIPADYIFAEHVRDNFPQLDVQYADSLLESLRTVAKGEAIATMATLPIALYQIERHGLGTLKISGHTSVNIKLSVGIRNDDPLLTSAFQKAVQAVPIELHDQILARWYRVNVEQARDYTILLVLVALLSVIAAFLSYRNYSSRKFNAQLAKVNARLCDRNRRLEQLGKRDYLTGVYHRINMDAELEKDIDHCASQGQPLHVILFDLDNFSQINIEHSHPVGDLLLIEVSRLVEERLPDNTYFGRWGGDSFLILCPQSSAEDTQKIAEVLHTIINCHRFSENVHLSATVAVATCHPHEHQSKLMKEIEQLIRDKKKEGPGQLANLTVDTAE